MKNIIFGILLFLPTLCFSQQLVYQATNPAFGGDTFNYQWLLNAANAQNGFEDPDIGDAGANSSLDAFNESLNRQILSRLSRDLFDEQFDGDNLEPGTFTFGTLEVEIIEGLNGLVINILDTGNGEQTQIIVPN